MGLDEAVRQALNTHPQALIGLNKIRAEEEKIDIARAGYLPTLDISVGAGGQKRLLPPSQQVGESSTHNKSYTRKEGSITFRQNIFSGFSTFQGVAQAENLTLAERYQLGATLEELALKVVNAYLKVLEHSELIELAEDNLKLHDEMYVQIKKRTDQGLARSSDLAQIEGGRARANANVINAHNNLADAKSEYYSLVGSMPADLKLPNVLNLQMPENLESALAKAIEDHPGIIATSYEVEAAEANYAAQKSGYLPSIDLEIDQSWKTNADGQLNTTKDFVAMARLRYNLFRGGADLSKVQESAYQVEESRGQKDRLLRTVEETLRLAWDSYEFLGEQIRYLQQHEEASKKTVEAYREQFYIGKRALLDLLDSENELFQSSQNLTRSIYQASYARYRVLAATGALLTTFNLSWGDGWFVDNS